MAIGHGVDYKYPITITHYLELMITIILDLYTMI